jgi:hypothetical protein
MNKNLKKLLYQYKFLKMELDDIKEEHSDLTIGFESLFSDIISKKEPETEEEIVAEALKPKKEKQRVENESMKKLYKDVAKKLHPDKGGSEEGFKELNKLYKQSDYLGIIEIAIENDIEFEVDDSDIELLKSIDKINKNIENIKTTLPYVWKYGNELQRRQVLLTMSMHLGVDIDFKELPDEVKKLIGMEINLDSTK